MLNLTSAQAVGAALLAGLLVGAGAGGWAAWQWTTGRQAKAEATQLRSDVQNWADTAEQLRAAATDLPLAVDAAVERLNAISQQREQDRAALRKFAAGLEADLARLRADHPDLRQLDLGADFLRHWNRANAGADLGSDPAATGATAQPGAAVPEPAVGDGQYAPGPAGGARPGSGPVSRLPQRQCPADPSCTGMAGDGLALVLRRSPAQRLATAGGLRG